MSIFVKSSREIRCPISSRNLPLSAALPSKIDAIKAFEWGVNNSPESNDDGFTHCFMVTFDSEEGREAYLPHPDHLAFVEVLKPVLDKVRVLDFWEQQ